MNASVESLLKKNALKKADGTKRENCGMKFRDSRTKSKTFEGIAQAMAQQWGDYLLGKTDKQLSFFEEG